MLFFILKYDFLYNFFVVCQLFRNNGEIRTLKVFILQPFLGNVLKNNLSRYLLKSQVFKGTKTVENY